MYILSFNKYNNSISFFFFYTNKSNRLEQKEIRVFSNRSFKKIKITFLNKSFKIKKKTDFNIFFLNKAFLLFFFTFKNFLKIKKKNFLFITINSIQLNKIKKKLVYNIFTKKGFFFEKSLFTWKKGKN